MSLEAKHVKLRCGKEFDVLFIPIVGSEEELTEAAYLASVADHSVESDAVFSGALMQGRFKIKLPKGAELVTLSTSCISGINLSDRFIRKGTLDAIEAWLNDMGGVMHNKTRSIVNQIVRRKHHAIVIADHQQDLGVVELVPCVL
jgi:K+-transporting ATPase ATPase B chain